VGPLWPLPTTKIEPIVAHQVNQKAEVVARHTGSAFPSTENVWPDHKTISFLGFFTQTSVLALQTTPSSGKYYAVGRVSVQEDCLTRDSHDPFTLLHLTLSATTCPTSFILHCTLGSRWIQFAVWFEHLHMAFKTFYFLTSWVVYLWMCLENKFTKSYFLTRNLPWVCNSNHQHFQGSNIGLKVARAYSDN
jgi:hypothetical protein